MATDCSTEGMPVYPKAAPPSGVVGGWELQDLFRAVKGAFHDLVSFSCTSGRMAPEGVLRTNATPRKHSLAVISGSRSDNANTPEGGNAAESSSPERERALRPMQRSTSGCQGEHRRKNLVYPIMQRSQPDPTAPPLAAECLRGEELHSGKPSS